MGDNTKKQSVISRAREIIDNYQGKEIRIMEVCGTHTHEIFRLGLRQILPPSIKLISGPGCPVCVTPVSFIDEAVLLATDHNATICTFGDLVRVPGSGVISDISAGKSSAEELSAKESSAEALSAEESSAEAPSAEESSAEAPSAEEFSAKELSAGKSSAEELSAKESSAEALSAKEFSAEAPSAEEFSAKESSAKTANVEKTGEASLKGQDGRSSFRKIPGSLAAARAAGARIQVVYAPQDAVAYAKEHPEEQVVFLSVGFETTTPTACLAVQEAQRDGVTNFSILTANKTMPAAYEAMRSSMDAFLYPGHVHAITGTSICEELAKKGTSGVVAGFTAKELLTAIAVIVKRTEQGEPFFENCYPRVVRPEGAPEAQKLVEEMMEPCDARWRGIGVLPSSGMKLREKYAEFDARVRFALPCIEGRENPACRCGEVLQGKCLPSDCGVFGRGCTPEHPVGACMVSGEGACSAFYLYGT